MHKYRKMHFIIDAINHPNAYRRCIKTNYNAYKCCIKKNPNAYRRSIKTPTLISVVLKQTLMLIGVVFKRL